MMLYKADAYIEIETDTEIIKLDKLNTNYDKRLSIDFDCFKNESSQPNKSTVTVYNLNRDTRNLIARSAKKIRFYAGYNEVFKLVAAGDIVFADSKRQPPDVATVIVFGDGQFNYQESQSRISFPEGTAASEIITKLAQDFGLPVKELPDNLNDAINSGLSLDSLTKDALDLVTGEFGLNWSVQDEELVVLRESDPLNSSVIVIKPSTGLIETPIITAKGIKFKAQLNPDIRPRQLIQIESEDWQIDSNDTALLVDRDKSYNGLYQCRNVSYTGNNYGGPFDVEVEAFSYGG